MAATSPDASNSVSWTRYLMLCDHMILCDGVLLLFQPQESRIVSQFHFTKWSKTTPPTDCRPMSDLIDELQRVQRKSGNMPITVHCEYVSTAVISGIDIVLL